MRSSQAVVPRVEPRKEAARRGIEVHPVECLLKPCAEHTESQPHRQQRTAALRRIKAARPVRHDGQRPAPTGERHAPQKQPQHGIVVDLAERVLERPEQQTDDAEQQSAGARTNAGRDETYQTDKDNVGDPHDNWRRESIEQGCEAQDRWIEERRRHVREPADGWQLPGQQEYACENTQHAETVLHGGSTSGHALPEPVVNARH